MYDDMNKGVLYLIRVSSSELGWQRDVRHGEHPIRLLQPPKAPHSACRLPANMLGIRAGSGTECVGRVLSDYQLECLSMWVDTYCAAGSMPHTQVAHHSFSRRAPALG